MRSAIPFQTGHATTSARYISGLGRCSSTTAVGAQGPYGMFDLQVSKVHTKPCTRINIAFGRIRRVKCDEAKPRCVCILHNNRIKHLRSLLVAVNAFQPDANAMAMRMKGRKLLVLNTQKLPSNSQAQ